MTEERVAQLGLADDGRRQPAPPLDTAFTVSIEARRGVTTGISARERAETIRVAVARRRQPEDLVTPGHVFPAARPPRRRARSHGPDRGLGGSRAPGRPEPAGVICEIMRDDGEMARMPDLEFSRKHGLPILTIADLIEYRLAHEMLVRPVAESKVRPRADGVSASSGRSFTRPTSRRRSTWRWCWAR